MTSPESTRRKSQRKANLLFQGMDPQFAAFLLLPQDLQLVG